MRRILIVDDDPTSCELIAYSLKSIGYRVVTAPDGSRAANMKQDGDIGLVVLDVHVAGDDGVEVLATLRGSADGLVRVIAVSRDDSAEARLRVLDLGFDAFLTKPVDLDELHGHVSRLMPDHSPAESTLRRRVRERGVSRRLASLNLDPRAGLVITHPGDA